MAQNEAGPIAFTHQWPEGRGFERVHATIPQNQARFVQALLGIVELQGLHDITRQSERFKRIEAATAVIVEAFLEEFPECLQTQVKAGAVTYRPDPRLAGYLDNLGGHHGQS